MSRREGLLAVSRSRIVAWMSRIAVESGSVPRAEKRLLIDEISAMMGVCLGIWMFLISKVRKPFRRCRV